MKPTERFKKEIISIINYNDIDDNELQVKLQEAVKREKELVRKDNHTQERIKKWFYENIVIHSADDRIAGTTDIINAICDTELQDIEQEAIDYITNLTASDNWYYFLKIKN